MGVLGLWTGVTGLLVILADRFPDLLGVLMC